MRPPASALPLARVDRFPEFTHPLPVDRQAADAHGRPVKLQPGLNGRFHVGIMEYHRGDFNLLQYQRTPWASIDWKVMLHALLTTRLAANAERLIGAPSRIDGGTQFIIDLRAFGPSGTNPTRFYNQTDAFDNADFKLYYSVTNPAGGANPTVDYEAALTAGPTFDDGNFRVTATGVNVHADAARIELHFKKAIMKWNDNTAARQEFLIDTTTLFLAYPTVNDGQTITLTFQADF